MKTKFFVIFLLVVTGSFTTSAETFYCNSPKDIPYDPYTGTYDYYYNGCGYIDEFDVPPSMQHGTGEACYQYYMGNFSAGDTLIGCIFYTAAPISNGLIFLIIAGLGLGSYVFFKNTKINLVSINHMNQTRSDP